MTHVPLPGGNQFELYAEKLLTEVLARHWFSVDVRDKIARRFELFADDQTPCCAKEHAGYILTRVMCRRTWSDDQIEKIAALFDDCASGKRLRMPKNDPRRKRRGARHEIPEGEE
jgi:hypothetical protein